MKKLIPLMMCLVLSVMAFAQTGVDFQHLTFDEALAKAKAEKKLVFVDCYTTWCGPCKMQSPVIDQLSEEMDDIKFTKMDVDQNQETARNLGIMAIPTLLIKKDGKIVDRLTGYTPKEKLEQILDQYTD